MAVVTVWKCDRDGAMFDNKKDAEEHDSMLELAANITSLIENQVDGLDEESAEKIGLVLAKRRDALAKACKGKPDILLEELTQPNEPSDSHSNADNLTQLSEVS
ncbi:YebG family protein [Sessilibacter corallicola]|uniref:YebG family protein n=1 Tax=Sessilibacter corallicola TaxID=2904075 RepID=A0ABQ0A7M5_9GAMM